ncbi:sodium:solute symporter family protein [Schleiferia thermophila]|jgi:Na+/proline symporter|uniref:sodium:solute symporter family protein n=1 Tax=Schleiferia thermophila TaxID=884107 RepID=UPI0004E6D846|nr:sodium:solute symporter family protein [Schleiferia thermophila]KFD39138.1 sodium:proline symporter [Schleiferia thermophila str. Yellowstone]PMB31596.1 sodium:proline symporter [Fischerella thermalis CCMEE 5319]
MSSIDYTIAIGGLMVFLYINLKLRKKGARNAESFFLGGRSLSWHLLGLSMVATTFAADTPLWVTEKVVQHGISGNWLWWNMLLGGMLTTFFFARYWRRAGIMTEPELISLRYSGPYVRPLRMFKALYLGLFLNAVIIGWVNAAMVKVLGEFFYLDKPAAFIAVMLLMAYTAIYSAISGLFGIVVTDALQFAIAMIGSVILAILVLQLPEVGGTDGLVQKLPEWRFHFFPMVESGTSDVLSITIGAFFSFIALQWWNSWYPGAEPGGGGYISQRMMGARNESDAVRASLLFQLAHYCLRPWPWIVVALAALVIYPGLTDAEAGNAYIRLIRDYMPEGIRGLMLLVFLSAYMSTISTQLNWGSSYLTNDFYHLIKMDTVRGDNSVLMGRIFTFLIMIAGGAVSSVIDTIDAAAQFLIQAGAGLGAVLILRWYWWRINAATEMVATIAPVVLLSISKIWIEPALGENFTTQNGTFYLVVFGTMITWILTAYLTSPTSEEVLTNFCKRVQPAGKWPEHIFQPDNSQLYKNLVRWLSAVVLAYSLLFLTGYALFGNWSSVLTCAGLAILAFIVLITFLRN